MFGCRPPVLTHLIFIKMYDILIFSFQSELDLATTIWNNHSIRRSRNTDSPSGSPNRLFQYPLLWNTRNYMRAVSQNDIGGLQDEVEARSLVCCDPDMYERCISIMSEDSKTPPTCCNEAIALYRHLRTKVYSA